MTKKNQSQMLQETSTPKEKTSKDGEDSTFRKHKKTHVFTEFISSLEDLETKDRGLYAVLKRAAGTVLGDSVPAMAAFYKILPFSEQNSRLEPIYYLIATLFPIQPQSGGGNFGKTMALVKKEFGDSTSIDIRFQNLLDNSLNSMNLDPNYGDLDAFREFSYRLRQCVNLAASKQIGISWYDLLTDLYLWSVDYDDTKKIQKKWVSEYYRTMKEPSSEINGEAK